MATAQAARRVSAGTLAEERAWLQVLPAAAHTAALGETRRVEADQTIRFGSVRYSTPDGNQGAEVWCPRRRAGRDRPP